MFAFTFNKPVQVTRFLLGVPSTQGGVELCYTPVFTSGAYDNAGRLTHVTSPVGLQGNLSYNAQGLISQAVAPAQVNVGSVPVVQSGVASSIAPNQRKVSLGYNIAGDLAQITDAQGNETRMGTDTLGRMTGSTDALGYSSSLQYNTLDQATQATDPLQQNTGLSYDSAGRVTAVTNAAGVQIERYGYDAKGRLTNGRRTARTTLNANGTGQGETPMAAVFDAANRMTAITLNLGGTSKTWNLTYDANGNLVQKQNAADTSEQTLYVWDASNRLIRIEQSGAGGASLLTASYSYDVFGRRIQNTCPGAPVSVVTAVFKVLVSRNCPTMSIQDLNAQGPYFIVQSADQCALKPRSVRQQADALHWTTSSSADRFVIQLFSIAQATDGVTTTQRLGGYDVAGISWKFPADLKAQLRQPGMAHRAWVATVQAR